MSELEDILNDHPDIVKIIDKRCKYENLVSLQSTIITLLVKNGATNDLDKHNRSVFSHLYTQMSFLKAELEIKN